MPDFFPLPSAYLELKYQIFYVNQSKVKKRNDIRKKRVWTSRELRPEYAELILEEHMSQIIEKENYSQQKIWLILVFFYQMLT